MSREITASELPGKAIVTAWRLALAFLLAALIATPLFIPLTALAADPSAWQTWSEVQRLASLAGNTLALVGGTLLLALPVGTLAAVLLYRTDLPLRRTFRFLTLLTLLVPLPLFASGWQAAVGSGGWLPLAVWNIPRAAESPGPGGIAWTPWGQGIGSAVWIHAMAALPWVILLVGQGLLRVERSLEEDALTVLPAWRVLLRVSLRRASLMIAAAALWVAVQAAGEITVTDVMQVRTFAEEVYTQLIVPEDAGRGDPVARAVAAALPSVLLLAGFLLVLATWWERRQATAAADPAPPLIFPLGPWRWPLAALTMLVCTLLIGIPVGSLIWRAGLAGTPRQWSAAAVREHLRIVTVVDSGRIQTSLGLAAGAGVVCAVLALLSAWAAAGSRWFRPAVLILVAIAWALPGPIVGLGLKKTIAGLLDATDSRVLAQVLWYGPSPAPLLWANLLRFFPFALAMLWPAVREVPPELREAARVDGAGPAAELWLVIRPLTAPAFWRTVLAVGVLSLGELSAGKLVSTPGMPSFAETIFTGMHYGITNDLAASCLLLLAFVTAGAAVLSASLRRA
jgi:iron(III) transport system permease protein